MKRFVLLACVALLSITLRAHDPGLGTAEVTLTPGEIRMGIRMGTGYSPADLVAVIRSTSPSLVSGLRGGTWSESDLAAVKPALDALAPRLWRVSRGRKELPLLHFRSWLESGNSVRIDFAYADLEMGTGYSAKGTGYSEKGTGWLEILDLGVGGMPAGHRDFLSVSAGGRVVVERLLDARTGVVVVPGAEVMGAPSTPLWAFIRLGVMHIWTGYDHLLFLFGLLVVCRSFRSIAGIISCFTVAHSLTLGLSTLNVVTTPSRIIEPAIAASILFVGIDNLVRRGAEPRGRWVLTFMFGLIHGFGFASALKELGVGSDGRSIALPLFSFNFGVEVGQIAIAAAVLPLVWQLRKRPAFVLRGVPALSALVAAMGLAWLLQRTLLA